MKQFVTLFLLLSFLMSCSSRKDSELYTYKTKQIIDLTDQSGGFNIIDKIGNIDILNLTVEESWVHLKYPRMAVSDDGYYFLSDRTFFLIGYDHAGKLKFAKQIKGRGRGETIDVGNMFMSLKQDSNYMAALLNAAI